MKRSSPTVRLGVLTLLAGMLLSGCPERAHSDNLYIRNETGAPISVYVESPSGSLVLITDSVRVRDTKYVTVPSSVEGPPKCTTGPLIALQRGREIERFEPPVCWNEPRFLTVDGIPGE